ncbi:hypothetical protein [Aurantimonas sp. 22II-16-19i]|uniref:hypothetical protein n=1 Tax=Aurantimonas sp. 22II-16-19i TaxID=1317114 RepID=UPI001594E554|nr:hypothetical protein [Aurantimonas sp. 22II-16-19i]
MQIVMRTAILATALGLWMGAAAAQSGESSGGSAAGGTPSGETNQQNPVLPPDAAPTPMSPAETETPQEPAAAGGEASDATGSGAPLGAAPTETPAGGSGQEAAPAAGQSGAAASDGQPRNAVGDKFQMPHLTPENQTAIITDLCGIQIRDMSPAACTCLAGQAMEQLSSPQRDYLIASVVAPPTADQLLRRGTVTIDDQKTIFAFLDATSNACKSGTYVKPDADAAPKSGG